MCGISGVFDPRQPVTWERLEAMAATLRHRGPDNTGFCISRDCRVGLAHNRLAILDVSEAGNQPMSTENRRFHIVFNGEIYNFRELRPGLEKKGHRFKSNSDTEVLLNLYAESGASALDDLNGMFAFCVFDEQGRRLFLARDRVGIKPLYYVHKNGAFAFASEIKPLLTLPFVSRDLDPTALDAYFTLGYIPEGLCIFKDIRKLRPAHWLRLDLASGALEEHRYWQPDRPGEPLEHRTESDLADMLEEKLRDSVRLRMVSDVPIGCFLSGGVDSSLVANLMAQEASEPIRTFTISFSSAAHDESPYARIVAQSIGSKHTEQRVEMDDAAALRDLVYHYDEPFSDSSMIPTYYVCKVAREQVTVVLSGDGGDELFGGYNWYSWMLRLAEEQRALGPLAGPVGRFARLLPRRFPHRGFLSCLSLDTGHQYLARIGLLTGAEKSALYGPAMRETLDRDGYSDVFARNLNNRDGDLLRKLSMTDFHHYLPDDILTKVDRASMAVSLEARVPWLDYRLVEFAYSVPSSLKIRDRVKKVLPKALARRRLPLDLDIDRKQGFSIPIEGWMRGDMGTMLEDALGNGLAADHLNLQAVRETLRRHRSGATGRYGWKLFAMLTFTLWHQRFCS